MSTDIARQPERFFGRKRNNIDRFVYFPFGRGLRLCIGRNFAMFEMQLLLITLYRRFRVNLQPGFMVEAEAMVTLGPRRVRIMSVVNLYCPG
jgi:cytochrome P450